MNPIITDGVLYGISAASNVFAGNAETGEQLWRFVPEFHDLPLMPRSSTPFLPIMIPSNAFMKPRIRRFTSFLVTPLPLSFPA